MASSTGIQWSDATLNPWRGCTKVSPGCANCYAEVRSRQNKKTLGVWGPNGTRVVGSEAIWDEPKKWNRLAAEGMMPDGTPNTTGRRPRVFTASLADVFEDWQGPMVDAKTRPLAYDNRAHQWRPAGEAGDVLLTMQGVRNRLAQLILDTPELDYLLLTKRPENVNAMWPLDHWPKNVWMGCTTENQEAADARLPHLFNIPAKLRFLSVEPQLEPINFGFGRIWCRHHLRFEPKPIMDTFSPCFRGQATAGDMVSWAIIGGESGGGARKFSPAWALDVINQCRPHGIAPFVKQLGAEPETLTLRDRKGGDWEEWPALLKVRELPEPVR